MAKTVSCTVNVALCREDEFQITPALRPLRVAVVGGGPAGMEAARVCALKGHTVTLYEKRELGGALLEASIPEFKAPDLKPLVAYLKTQVEKLGITVVPKEATLADLTGGAYDAVIVAPGRPLSGWRTSRVSPIPRWSRPPRCYTAKSTLGDTVAVIGGGIVGTEVGLVLAEQGKEVIFVEMLDEFMCNITFDERQVYEERFQPLNVTINTGQRLVAVTDSGITVADRSARRPRSRPIRWCSPRASDPTAN